MACHLYQKASYGTCGLCNEENLHIVKHFFVRHGDTHCEVCSVVLINGEKCHCTEGTLKFEFSRWRSIYKNNIMFLYGASDSLYALYSSYTRDVINP